MHSIGTINFSQNPPSRNAASLEHLPTFMMYNNNGVR